VLRRSPDAPGPLRRTLARWRGVPVVYDLARYEPLVAAVAAREPALRALGDAELRRSADALRAAVARGAPSPATLADGLALVREAARRTIGLRAFDVQVAGAAVLYDGRVAELETGEGKTLVAALAAALRALEGRGVHVCTFNDYLARRDAEWMGPVYAALGLRVACVTAARTAAERRAAYAADVTCVTAKEAGFDYLRDGLVSTPGERVHRGFPYAIVDEADSILIDEARVPLVIAGEVDARPDNAARLAALVAGLEADVHFEADPQGRYVHLTEAGTEAVEERLGCGPLSDPANLPWTAGVNLALHARALLTRDVDYLVRDGAIQLVDEFTGRVVPDRQWPDGLQAALVAKEGLATGREGDVLGSITLQSYFALYERLAGMTATARTEAEELRRFYGLDVVVLPPNRPTGRVDRPPRIYARRAGRDRAVVAEIAAARRGGRPVLVGTASVRESEALAAALRAVGIPCDVLNAKTDALEAALVAQAGAPGAVTISTNLAGRGTDIRLGGADERDRAAVVAAGGLYVIGTNLHESRRIDRQLRGRAGRQGDVGESCFLVSLEDDLCARHGVVRLIPPALRAADDRPLRGDELTHPLPRRRIEWAQRVVEGQNFDIRRTLWRYSALVERQRRHVRARRDALVDGEAPGRWAVARPERWSALVAAVGADRAGESERRVALHLLDALWRDHLARVDDLREGIHFWRLANRDPVQEFVKAADDAFRAALARYEDDRVATFDALPLGAEGLALEAQGIRPPSATWTYLVDDDPFRLSLGLHVSGDLALSLGAALHYPLYMAVALWRRLRRRREPA
jgi:preprotein translocase subunit SecA